MLRKIARRLAAVVAVLLLAPVAVALWIARGGLPRRAGELEVRGATAPIEIRFDRLGVPAVRAASSIDLAFALGWLHANDRLFQMELTRHSADGSLAELFGERALRHDRRIVRLGFRGALRRLAATVGAESRARVEAYAAGVNAWLDERGGDLPPELRLLRHRPERWRPEDTLGVLFVMARQLSDIERPREEERFELLAAFGPERARELAGDPAAIVFDEVAELARTLPRHEEELGARAEGAGLGSNNWVVAPERSVSGGALLANDPHLGLRLPGVWFPARLEAPDENSLGMTLPGAPGVVLGRGPALAWGCTNLYLDDVDVFFEKTDPSGTKVLRGNRWVPLEVERESISVDGRNEEIDVSRSDRGAFLPADPERGLPARSVAWTGWSPADQISAFLALARASSAAEIRDLVAPFVFPAQNLVVASAEGDIAWTPLGRGPARFGWDGKFPAPAWRDDVGWNGLVTHPENPLLVDPESAEIATANSVLPVETPSWFGEEFDTPHRVERIRRSLAARRDWSVESLAGLQEDSISLWAREVVAALGPANDFAGDAAQAASALVSWDGSMNGHGPAALFALFERELQRRTFEDEARAERLARFGTRARLAALLAGRLDASFWDDVSTPAVEGRQEIVTAALEAAWKSGVARWGSEIATWPYGSIHRLRLDHPLGGLPVVGRFLSRGPYELPGSATTILAFGGPWIGDEMDVTYGPSMRFVTDAADPERTFAALPGGQSGHPFDEHYDDRIAPFLAGEVDPMAWSDAEIERVTVSIVRLVPRGGGSR